MGRQTQRSGSTKPSMAVPVSTAVLANVCPRMASSPPPNTFCLWSKEPILTCPQRWCFRRLPGGGDHFCVCREHPPRTSLVCNFLTCCGASQCFGTGPSPCGGHFVIAPPPSKAAILLWPTAWPHHSRTAHRSRRSGSPGPYDMDSLTFAPSLPTG